MPSAQRTPRKSALTVELRKTFQFEAAHLLPHLPKSQSPIGEMEGWLRLELVNSTNRDEEKTYQINNNILSALIRAKVPILSFEAEGGK